MTSAGPSVTLQPLRSSDFITALRSFMNVLRTCKGPKAGVKVLVSSEGLSTVTTSSSRLLGNLVLANPVCVMVSQVMRSQTTTYGDHGLYTGILASSTMDQILSQDRVPQDTASILIQHLSSAVTSFLKSNCIKLSLDFTTVKQLLPVVQTILSSKPACGLTKVEITALSVKVVKAFLNTVDEDLGEVIVINAGASEGQSIVIQGVLYQTRAEGQVLHILEQRFTDKNLEIPLMLFNIMLTDDKSPDYRRDLDTVSVDVERKPDIVARAMYLLEQAVKFNVGIVACQKVVHSSLRLFLQRNGIVLLERMGTELTGAVEKLSRAKPISSLEQLTPAHVESCLGSVGSAQLVTQGKKQFILLEKAGLNVATLLLYAPGEEAYAELKVVTEQALGALRQLLRQPCVAPGASCLEAWLAARLQLQARQVPEQFRCTKSQLEAAIGWLQRGLLSAAGVPTTAASALAVDSVYCHAWRQTTGRCCCGLVTDSSVHTKGGKWVVLNPFSMSGTLFPDSCPLPDEPKAPEGLHEAAIVDVYSSKCNALKLALESCVHMLSIGLIVYKPPP